MSKRTSETVKLDKSEYIASPIIKKTNEEIKKKEHIEILAKMLHEYSKKKSR